MIATSSTPPLVGPARTCVGCRQVAPQASLLRVALVDERPAADPRRRLPGRGAYVHTTPACLTAAGKGGLARAFKRPVSRADLDAIARGASAALAAGNRAGFAVETAAPSASAASPSSPKLSDPTDSSHRHGA